MLLEFKINEDNLGTFAPDEKALLPLMEEMHKIVENIKDPRKDLPKAAKAMKALTLKSPLFLRGLAVLGEMYFDLDNEKAVAEAHARGAKAALKLIPEDYSGPMDMDSPEVQCFLRCHAGYAESLVEGGQYKEAFALTRRHLLFDPEDMFCRGEDAGELAILAGEFEEAARILEADVESRPVAGYSLAYLAFLREDFAASVALLRRAFVLAPYTVDFLTGRVPSPNVFWEGGPHAIDFHENVAYLKQAGGEIWSKSQEAVTFMEWLSQTSLALGERAKMASVSEKCMAAENGEEMKEAEAEWDALLKSITEESGAKLLEKMDDPDDGEEMLPWLLYAKARDRTLNEPEFEFDETEDEE